MILCPGVPVRRDDESGCRGVSLRRAERPAVGKEISEVLRWK
ncbi:hypothetical protein TPMD04_57 [Thiohalocapsa phage LS06-2018-MD04]|nr:hypothetical protein TPMD04_57 [Thiohalocapsa phage LS06-2018-MD04]